MAFERVAKWFDGLLWALAPGMAVARLQARAVKAAYEATVPTTQRNYGKEIGGPDDASAIAAIPLIQQARHLDQNNDLARGVLDTLINFTVGTGIRPEPQVANLAGDLHMGFNAQLVEAWEKWVERPEVTREFDYYTVQRMEARTLYRDGEYLNQKLFGDVRGLRHPTPVKYSLECLEPDYCPVDLNDEKLGIRQGVEKNGWGEPRAYYIARANPSELMTFSVRASDYRRVPAERIRHVKLVDRFRQTRGVSIFASVIGRLSDIKDGEESERVAMRVAAALTAFIKKGDPTMFTPLPSGQTGPNRTIKMYPGMVADSLKPGEDVGVIKSDRPNNNLIAFRDSQLRAVAAGTRSTFSSIAKNYNGTYSSQRQELSEGMVSYAVLHSFLVEMEVRPTWQDFVVMAEFSGAVKVPPDVDRLTILRADFSRPRIPWIDPLKEANAEKVRVDMWADSLAGVIRDHGDDPGDIFKQRAREMQIVPAPNGAAAAPPPDQTQQDGEDVGTAPGPGERSRLEAA